MLLGFTLAFQYKSKFLIVLLFAAFPIPTNGDFNTFNTYGLAISDTAPIPKSKALDVACSATLLSTIPPVALNIVSVSSPPALSPVPAPNAILSPL